MLATQHWTPLQWWSPTDLAELSRRLDSAVNGWRNGWFSDAYVSPAGSRCFSAHDADQRSDVEWRLLGGGSGAAAWIFVPDVARDDMRVALFAAEGGPIASDVANTAVAEYEEALRTVLQLLPETSREKPSARTFHRWEGSMFAELPWVGGQRSLLLMNAECVTRLLGARARPKAIGAHRHELVACESALASTKVLLGVELEPCELEIGNLAALQLGDVIPWPHALEHPLNVCMDDGTRICSGHLGRIDSFKGVELLA